MGRMTEQYTLQERELLLSIARQSITQVADGDPLTLPDLSALPPVLSEERACFVTLHRDTGALRGCTGTLVARQPLAHEVARMAVQTAFHDPRFSPVLAVELPSLVIEISILTPSAPLAFETPAQIPDLLRPHIDGVLMVIGLHRATFLPQVWDRAPDPRDFLDLLCRKMGLPPGAWQDADVEIATYQTIIIEEEAAPI
jgi:AmmeMemoRadiSam system protein A